MNEIMNNRMYGSINTTNNRQASKLMNERMDELIDGCMDGRMNS